MAAPGHDVGAPARNPLVVAGSLALVAAAAVLVLQVALRPLVTDLATHVFGTLDLGTPGAAGIDRVMTVALMLFTALTTGRNVLAGARSREGVRWVASVWLPVAAYAFVGALTWVFSVTRGFSLS
jgi:hypothetical protein